MSPDKHVFPELIAAATTRAKALLVAEAAAAAATAAGVAFELTRVSGWPMGRRTIAAAAVELVAALVVALTRRRRTSRHELVRAIERTHPASRNVLLTVDEISAGSLQVSAATRSRVFADADAIAHRVDLTAAVPSRTALRLLLVAAIVWSSVALRPLWQRTVRPIAPAAVRLLKGDAGDAEILHVEVIVQPPPYTSLTETTSIDPPQLQAIEGSTLTITADTRADAVSVEHDGATRTVSRGPDGRLTDRVQAAKNGYLLVAAGGARRLIPLVVVPDALPSVRLAAPGRDLVYAGGNPRIAFDARASDDFGLRSLRLRYTKVSGSGENFDVVEGEIPLDVTRASAREWSGHASRSLGELGLQQGEMIVYRAVAADARPGQGTATSDSYIIEISKLGVAAGDAFTLPQQESRYALSQQMLIVKTGRLQQRRGAMGVDAFREEALNLAVEQRMIRAEFVFMLGGEVENEEVEAEQSSELQEGRLQNRGQRDLRAATVAMSQAEKALTGANTGEALVAERAAVTALQRAFARDRYILRALAARNRLDLGRRLTGNRSGAADWRRTTAPAPPNRRAALLEDLLQGLADAARERDPSAARRRASLLAAEAVRIDAASPALRGVAASLQQMQDASADPAAAARALNAAAAAAVTELRRAHADPAAGSSAPASDLGGAFVDALRAGR